MMVKPGFAPSTSFFVAGGTLQLNVPSYVERPADRELYEHLRNGDFCYVLNSRQMGKSSLMARIASKLRQDGFAVAVVDLTQYGQTVTVEQWYDAQLGRIGQNLGLEDQLERFWLDNQRLAPLDRWVRAIREVVLARTSGPVVIFVDEIDFVRSLPFPTDEYFAAIRSFHNDRDFDEGVQRIAFCLLGVATPSDLIRYAESTPFNLGYRIDLTDFGEEAVDVLAVGLQREDAENARQLIKRVLWWTDGHPYLTQRLCEAVAQDRSIKNAQDVDDACRKLFLDAGQREQNDNLRFVSNRVLASDEGPAAILDLYAKVLRGEKVADDITDSLVNTLRLSGIAKPAGRYLRLRNRIYERVFDAAWIERNMPGAEIRRQRAAYRRGVIRALINMGLIAALIALGLVTWQYRALKRETDLRISAEKLAKERGIEIAKSNAAEEVRRKQETLDDERLAIEAHTREADLKARLYDSGNLAGLASTSLASDPEQSALLALQAVATTMPDKTVTPQAQDALRSAVRSLRTTFVLRQGSPAKAVAFGGDGKLLASAGDDRNIIVWDSFTGKELFVLNCRTGTANSLAFDPNGTRLASVESDGITRLWDASTGKEIWERAQPGRDVRSVAFSPDGTMVASGMADGRIQLWSARDGQPGRTLTGHSLAVNSLSFSPTGKRLLSGSSDMSAILWDTMSGSQLYEPVHCGAPVWSVAFSADDSKIALGCGFKPVAAGASNASPAKGPSGQSSFIRRGVQVLNAWKPSQAIRTFDVAEGAITGVSLGAAGNLATASTNGVITVDSLGLSSSYNDYSYDFGSSSVLGRGLRFSGHHGIVAGLAFAPDGLRIATAGEDATVKIWNAGPKREYLAFNVRGSGGLDVSPDGTKLMIAGDNRLNIWDTRTGVLLRSIESGPTGDIAFSRNSVFVSAVGDDGKSVRRWRLEGGAPVSSFSFPSAEEFPRATFGQSRDRLAAAGAVWDVASGKRLFSFSAARGQAALSADGRLVAAWGQDGKVDVWDVDARKLAATLPVKFGPVKLDSTDGLLSFSLDGRRLAVAVGSIAQIWDARAGKMVTELIGHLSRIANMDWSATRFATGSLDHTARIWDPSSGTTVAVLSDHTEGISTILFVPGGHQLVTVDSAEVARVFAVEIEDLAALTLTRLSRSWKAEDCVLLPTRSCPASSSSIPLYIEGSRLARLGDVQGAGQKFREAQNLPDHIVTLDPEKLAGQVAAEASGEAQRFTTKGLMASGERLARAGNVSAAVNVFREAARRDPSLQLDPDQTARDFEDQERRLARLEIVRKLAPTDPVKALEVVGQINGVTPLAQVPVTEWSRDERLALCWAATSANQAERAKVLCEHVGNIVIPSERSSTKVIGADVAFAFGRAVNRAKRKDYDGSVLDLEKCPPLFGTGVSKEDVLRYIDDLKNRKDPFSRDVMLKIERHFTFVDLSR